MADSSTRPANPLSGLLDEGKSDPEELYGPRLHGACRGVEGADPLFADQRSSRRLPIPSKSIKPALAPEPARVILTALSRTGSSLRRSHARPSSRFAPGAGSWKRPDHGRSSSAS